MPVPSTKIQLISCAEAWLVLAYPSGSVPSSTRGSSMIEQINNLLTLSDTPRYNIKAVVQQTQVNISTLRAWEQRYGVPHPQRSGHGHRLYSQRDIAIITWLRQCTENG